MQAPKKRVAVIGAGVSGLTSIKACREEIDAFSEIICYEKSDEIGGLWHYRETDDITTVQHTTVANSSKEMSAFSDFPPEATTPNYMHHKVMLKYLIDYANKFELLDHIRTSHEIMEVYRATDEGKWIVRVKDVKKNQVKDEKFDLVMVCTGHHTHAYSPVFAGQQKFKGKIIHASKYKKAHEYMDKKALVIGAGNSGLDIAAELSSVCSKVILSTRSGCWVLPRLGFRGGRPADTSMLRRSMHFFKDYFPATVVSFVIETLLNKRFDHELFNLRPSHPIFYEHPTVNDVIASKILTGAVTVKADVAKITEEGVHFEGDSSIAEEVDLIVLATGYVIDYPFISEKLRKKIICKETNRTFLYKYIFPIVPDEQWPLDPELVENNNEGSTVKPRLCETLGFVGVPNALGPMFPIAELQARLFVQVATGKASLPSLDGMLEDFEKQEIRKMKKFTHSLRHGVQVEWTPYLDDIASQIGAKPDFRQLLFDDFKLCMKLIFGPSVPYQYRLKGAHAWEKAKETIMEVSDRIDAPFKESKRPEKSDKESGAVANKRYFENAIIFQIFFGIIIVLVMELLFMYSR